MVRVSGLGFCVMVSVRVSIMGSGSYLNNICSCVSFCSAICRPQCIAGRGSLWIALLVTERRYTTYFKNR